MIKPQDKMVANLIAQLHRDLPLEPLTRLVNLAVVARWLPTRADVLLLGDREFGTGVLAQWALRQGWGLCLRLRAHESVCRAGAPQFELLPLLLPGERRFWPHVTFTQKQGVSGL